MIKIALTKDLSGVTYNKDIIVWFGFINRNKTTFECMVTYHNTVQEAEENTVKRTDTQLMKLCGLNSEYSINLSDISGKLTVEELKLKLQEIIVDDMKAQLVKNNNDRVSQISIL
jgi:hypothetical protein